ncbi:hypothetical protein ACF06X_26545 [Streptomyces sp. NPDC015346]|uniref:hypothetical protein n=1 Tax=Streptomyces sp. NPDC015346 TaxID=3364954 RepID=UPI0036FFEB0E
MAIAALFCLRSSGSSSDSGTVRADTSVEPSTVSASSARTGRAAVTAGTNSAAAALLTPSTRCTAGTVPAGATSSTVTVRPSARIRWIAWSVMLSSSAFRLHISASPVNWSTVPREPRRTGMGEIDMPEIVRA